MPKEVESRGTMPRALILINLNFPVKYTIGSEIELVGIFMTT
jgi:hypothetical protein